MNRFLTNGQSSTIRLDLHLCTRISNADNLSLIKNPDMMEVKSTLFSIDSSKKPGPDGFGSGFFKQYWEVLKNDFFQCIVEFF